jgi:caffeoyl-CoA O-methyltransferase
MSRSIGLTPELEAYVRGANRAEHDVLRRCREETARDHADTANMQISPEQGAFLQLLASLTNARDAIEVGVFTGYSAVATALRMHERHGEEARLIACDVSEDYMRQACGYVQAAGVAAVIEPRVGPALASLDQLLGEGEAGGFDLAFVDADKTGYVDYHDRIVELLRPGGVVAYDNVLWDGDVADPSKTDADTEALRAIADKAKRDPRVDVAFTAIGDGLLLCVKR